MGFIKKSVGKILSKLEVKNGKIAKESSIPAKESPTKKSGLSPQPNKEAK